MDDIKSAMMDVSLAVAGMQARIEDEKTRLLVEAPTLADQREVFKRLRVIVSKMALPFDVLFEWCFYQ